VPTLAELDAQHRAAQAANAERVAKLVLAYWLLRVDGENVVQTAGPWMDFSVAAILRGYEQSHLLAAAYALAVRNQEIPGATPIQIPRPTPPPEEKLRRSLGFTGPGTAVQLLRTAPEPVAPPATATPEERERFERQQQSRAERVQIVMQKAGAAAAASTYKNVQNGGRDTTDALVVQKVAVGYVRVTKDKPCGWCLMLASRGPVYAADSFDASNARFTGPGDHKVHDDCGCALRPLYSRLPEHWTPQAREADKLWENMSRETRKTGKEAVAEFRRRAKELGLADLTR
jgi:hypothetical protein